MCWISNEREGSERMGGRGSLAKHSHKLQAADQTQANSTAAGKKTELVLTGPGKKFSAAEKSDHFPSRTFM